MDADEAKLRWVQRNWSRRSRTAAVGVLVDRLVQQVEAQDHGVCEKVTPVLSAMVDETFSRHCRLGGLRGRTLRVCVDQPGLVAIMRSQWLSTVIRAVAAADCRRWVGNVLFEWESDGG